MTTRTASRNGHPPAARPFFPTPASHDDSAPQAESQNDPAAQIQPQNDPAAPAAMAALEDYLLQCSAEFPHQLHLRGLRRSGKSTLAAAMDDGIQTHGNGPTDRSAPLLLQGLRIVHGEGAAPTPFASAGRDSLDRIG
jgi:hypothetical protein